LLEGRFNPLDLAISDQLVEGIHQARPGHCTECASVIAPAAPLLENGTRQMMRIKATIVSLALFTIATVRAEDEVKPSYECLADETAGFYSGGESWTPVVLLNPPKYLIAPIGPMDQVLFREPEDTYGLKESGEDGIWPCYEVQLRGTTIKIHCRKFGDYLMNPETLHFLYAQDPQDGSLEMFIGTCSKR
jgi:hypothetical protein